MTKYDNRFPLTEGLNPWIALPVVLLFSIGSMIAFSEIAILLINKFFGLGRFEFYSTITKQTLNDTEVWALYLFQAFSAVGGFIAGPLLYLLVLERHSVKNILSGVGGTTVVLTTVIVISFMVVNAVVLKWNMSIELPDFMEGIEQWARQKEEDAAQLTRKLTSMPTLKHLLVALLVIAVLPAIGEELLFRGVIQNKLYAGIGNIHWAIWISAMIFSAIHFQFYGFFPRMLLGALFGYLYFWSGNLLVPVIAHFINNGFTIVAIYFNQQGLFDYDLEEPPTIPLSAFLIFFVITLGAIWYFYQHHKGKYKEGSREYQGLE